MEDFRFLVILTIPFVWFAYQIMPVPRADTVRNMYALVMTAFSLFTWPFALGIYYSAWKFYRAGKK